MNAIRRTGSTSLAALVAVPGLANLGGARSRTVRASRIVAGAILFAAALFASPVASTDARSGGRSGDRAAAGGTAETTSEDSALRARRGDFDARGRIACAQERGQPMGECTAGVARDGGGSATVVARFPNGFGRTLRFERGEFVSADATMSGNGSDIDWRKRGELHLIRVDDQRYELRDDFVFGR